MDNTETPTYAQKAASKAIKVVERKKIIKTKNSKKPARLENPTEEKKQTEKSNESRKRKLEQMEVDAPQIKRDNNGESTEVIPDAPVFPADKARKIYHKEERKVTVPQHRLNPLKTNWEKLVTPIVEYLHLNVRFNIKSRQVHLKTSAKTEDISNLQKAADFLQAFMYGFEIDDALALIRLHDLYLETFDVKDVKHTLSGDHVGRAVGRVAGKGGKTRFTLENATKTRIVLADSRIHILGAYQNIAAVRRAICNLILGSPPSKVFGNLKAYSEKMCERM